MASLERHTTYPNYEVLPLATGTDSPKPLPDRTKFVRVAQASTPLKVYSAAIKQAEGEYVLLLAPTLEAREHLPQVFYRPFTAPNREGVCPWT